MLHLLICMPSRSMSVSSSPKGCQYRQYMSHML